MVYCKCNPFDSVMRDVQISITPQIISYIKKEYFEISYNEFFEENNKIGIGDSVEINPVITSASSVDTYVFIRVEMPVFMDDSDNTDCLYTLVPDTNLTLVDSYEVTEKWIEVYG